VVGQAAFRGTQGLVGIQGFRVLVPVAFQVLRVRVGIQDFLPLRVTQVSLDWTGSPLRVDTRVILVLVVRVAIQGSLGQAGIQVFLGLLVIPATRAQVIQDSAARGFQALVVSRDWMVSLQLRAIQVIQVKVGIRGSAARVGSQDFLVQGSVDTQDSVVWEQVAFPVSQVLQGSVAPRALVGSRVSRVTAVSVPRQESRGIVGLRASQGTQGLVRCRVTRGLQVQAVSQVIAVQVVEEQAQSQ